ncbi:zinc-dependent metalloprotease [Mariniblastus sp.]|nr:zinc-dependent metalloprotease [Mariniblastus sp.]MDB4756488.1 zinc-dependent metalloprotease [Mariniblastus sp.]
MKNRFLVMVAFGLAIPVFNLAQAQSPATSPAAKAMPKPDYPPLDKVVEGYKEVPVSDGTKPFLRLWRRDKDGQMYAELPKTAIIPNSPERHFIALTVSGGESFAGLQQNDFFVKYRIYGKRLAIIAPNQEIRTTGEDEARRSIKRLFTDKVLTDVPIVAMNPRGGPVIDFDELLVKQASLFFGGGGFMSGGIRITKPHLARISMAKTFPGNTEIAFEAPMSDGTLKTLHYSISKLTKDPTYKPRLADQRIGYFTTSYSDYGKYDADDVNVRFINRWHLEKRDPKLSISPPKKPIHFYIEHTTPVRYRRWVQRGIEYWNKAFEKVGISDAIIVHQQDSATGAYMDLAPEDVRYNFVRWLNNNVSTAIGPSRVHPETGQILDADIVLTDGWIRVFERQFNEEMPRLMSEGFSPETFAWLAEHPEWDPRVRLADPADRPTIIRAIQAQARLPRSGHPSSNFKTKAIGDDVFDGLYGRTSQVNGYCQAADRRAFDVGIMRMMLANGYFDDEKKDDEKKDDEKKDDKPKEQILDGIPESFIGPLLADLVCHEVGHTLGLRHNFRASSIYSLDEINSENLKGKKALAGSVMDYLPTNFNTKKDGKQGDYGMIGVGPYDMWAIEYGYSFASDLKPILARVKDPMLTYGTDEDTSGPDPLAQRYDFSKDPLDFAKSQMRLAKYHRERILKSFVKDGDAWSKARTGYEMTLSMQTRSTSMMSRWVGGAFISRHKKGDIKDKAPIEVVPVKQQRAALDFIIESTFNDAGYGLTPDLLRFMSASHWRSSGRSRTSSSPTWPIHDRIMGIQASTLTQLMNPTTLRNVYDNEFRIPADQDALTLPEMMDKLTKSIWSELDNAPVGEYSDRKPMISSLRRNLQREHLERLIGLMLSKSSAAASKPISNLSMTTLMGLKERIDTAIVRGEDRLDAYTKGHLLDAKKRIEKVLDADYIVNAPAGGSNIQSLIFGQFEERNER